MSKVVKLQASDGHELDAYVAKPEGKPWGGLVVVQEIFGVNQHIRSVADRFAQEGFYAVAPALFDRVERNVELGDDAGEGMQKGHRPGAKNQYRRCSQGCGCGSPIHRQGDRETSRRSGLLLRRNTGLAERNPAGAGRRCGLLRRPHREVRSGKAAGSCHASLRQARQPYSGRPMSTRCRRLIRRWRSIGMTPGMHSITTPAPATTQKAAKEAMARTLTFFNRHL